VSLDIVNLTSDQIRLFGQWAVWAEYHARWQIAHIDREESSAVTSINAWRIEVNKLVEHQESFHDILAERKALAQTGHP